MEPEDFECRDSMRLAIYRRLAGSLVLYLSFFTGVHVLWTICGAFLETLGVTVAFLGHTQSLVTVLELLVIGVVVVHRWHSTFCAVVSAVAVPVGVALGVFLFRALFLRSGALYDPSVYGDAADWNNAKSSHLSAAYASAYRWYVLSSSIWDWIFLMTACVLTFYGKYCILATHRSVQHGLAKIARIGKATTCCVCGDHAGTFFFFTLHITAGGIAAAVICSRLGVNSQSVDPQSGQVVAVYDQIATVLKPTPNSAVRYQPGGHDIDADDVSKFFMLHWFWAIFGIFNGGMAAVLHVLGDRNVLVPLQAGPRRSSSSNPVIRVGTSFGQQLPVVSLWFEHGTTSSPRPGFQARGSDRSQTKGEAPTVGLHDPQHSVC